MDPDVPGLTMARQLALAGLTGLAVGLEREWSGHATGPGARFGGVRTFLLLGLLGGIGGLAAAEGHIALAAVLTGAGGLLSVVAYAVAAQQTGDRDGTTEAAALLVLAVGVLCGAGYTVLGSGVAAVAVLALAEKSRIQGMVAKIGESELLAALRFAVLALVVLPLLPAGPFGPYGAIRPRELWSIVLVYSGLNFLGYLARRAVGPERGYGVTGLLGGLVSSTAVALSFSRRSRQELEYSEGLGLGVIAACTVLIPRVFGITLMLNPAVARDLVPYLALPFLVGAAFVARILMRSRSAAPGQEAPGRNPLGFLSAVQMVVVFQAVLLLIPAAERLWGSAGVLGSAAVLGLTDMDALTYSMARLGDSGTAALAAKAISVGLLANTVLKLVMVLGLGSPRFRRTAAPGLVTLAAAVAVGLVARS